MHQTRPSQLVRCLVTLNVTGKSAGGNWGLTNHPSGKSPISCPAPIQKYFPFLSGQITGHVSSVSSPEGRLAIVTNAGRDAVDATASARNRGRRAVLWIRERLT